MLQLHHVLQLIDDEKYDSTTLGVNYMIAMQPNFTLQVDNYAISVQQDLKLGLGGVVWDCGIALTQYLMNEPSLLQGKSVIELGAGTGIVK